MLLFKKKFLDAIRHGAKTQTIRVWKHCRIKTGQRSYIPGVGYIRVLAVDPIALDSLTAEDALLDGFQNLDELRHELTSLYVDQDTAGHGIYRIRFRLAPEEQKKQD